MLGFIQADLSTAGHSDHAIRAPRLRSYVLTLDAFRSQTRNLATYIGAHQVKLMSIVFSSRMHSRFSRRQREDQPAMPRIH
jgi:hypothetical protein